MYDELVKRLRHSANFAERGLAPPPSELREAADAIEKLSMRLHGDEAAIAGMKREIERMVVTDKLRWIPVTERLPEAGERVLCYCRANIYEVMKMRTDGDWVYDTNHVYMHSFVTHWMPLPEPPKGE